MKTLPTTSDKVSLAAILFGGLGKNSTPKSGFLNVLFNAVKQLSGNNSQNQNILSPGNNIKTLNKNKPATIPNQPAGFVFKTAKGLTIPAKLPATASNPEKVIQLTFETVTGDMNVSQNSVDINKDVDRPLARIQKNVDSKSPQLPTITNPEISVSEIIPIQPPVTISGENSDIVISEMAETLTGEKSAVAFISETGNTNNPKLPKTEFQTNTSTGARQIQQSNHVPVINNVNAKTETVARDNGNVVKEPVYQHVNVKTLNSEPVRQYKSPTPLISQYKTNVPTPVDNMKHVESPRNIPDSVETVVRPVIADNTPVMTVKEQIFTVDTPEHVERNESENIPKAIPVLTEKVSKPLENNKNNSPKPVMNMVQHQAEEPEVKSPKPIEPQIKVAYGKNIPPAPEKNVPITEHSTDKNVKVSQVSGPSQSEVKIPASTIAGIKTIVVDAETAPEQKIVQNNAVQNTQTEKPLIAQDGLNRESAPVKTDTDVAPSTLIEKSQKSETGNSNTNQKSTSENPENQNWTQKISAKTFSINQTHETFSRVPSLAAVEKLVHLVEKSAQSNKTHVNFKVDTREFGEIELRFTRESGTNQGTIVVGSEQVSNEFQKLLPVITEQLANKNIDMTMLNVQVNGSNRDRSHARKNQQDSSFRNGRYSDGAPLQETRQRITIQDFGYNTIEYIA